MRARWARTFLVVVIVAAAGVVAVGLLSGDEDEPGEPPLSAG